MHMLVLGMGERQESHQGGEEQRLAHGIAS
jgi:hypothetical protein